MPSPTFSYAVGQPVPFPCLRTTEGRFYSVSGYVYAAQPFVPRDGHYLAGARHLLVEGPGTNIFRDSENLTTANYTRTLCAIGGSVMTPDAVPNNVVSGIIANSGTVAAKVVSVAQSWPFGSKVAIAVFAKAGNKSNFFIQTTNKAGAVATSWVNLTTGTPGTTAATHLTPFLWSLANGWYRIETVLTGVGNGAAGQTIGFGASDADNNLNVTGDGVAVNAYCWGRQSSLLASGNIWPTSYIPNPGSGTSTRAADNFATPSHTAPQMRTLYADATVISPLGDAVQGGTGPYFCIGAFRSNEDFGVGDSTSLGGTCFAAADFNGTEYDSPDMAVGTTAGTHFELRGSLDNTIALTAGFAVNGAAETTVASTPVLDVFGPAYLPDDSYRFLGNSQNGALAIRRVADFIGPPITLQDCRDGFVAAPVPPSPPTPTLCHNLPFHTYERVKKFWGMPPRHGGHL